MRLAALVCACNSNLLQVVTCVVLPQRLQEAEGRNQELTSTISQGGWHKGTIMFIFNVLTTAVLIGYPCSHQTSSETD